MAKPLTTRAVHELSVLLRRCPTRQLKPLTCNVNKEYSVFRGRCSNSTTLRKPASVSEQKSVVSVGHAPRSRSRSASTSHISNLILFIASIGGLYVFLEQHPPPVARFDFEIQGTDGDDSKLDKLSRYLRRANFYGLRSDHQEVYEASRLALEECKRLGIDPGSPLASLLYHNCAASLFHQKRYDEALELLDRAKVAAMDNLETLSGQGMSAEEMDMDYLGRNRKIDPTTSVEVYERMQSERKAIFKQVVQLQLLKAETLATKEDEAAEIEAMNEVVLMIEKELGADYRRAPDLPVAEGALSKMEVFDILEPIRNRLLYPATIQLALPFSQRLLAILQKVDGDTPSCPQVDSMRWLAINMAGAGVKLEREQGKRTGQVRQLYLEAKQWSQQALDIAADIRASGSNGDFPHWAPSDPDEPNNCDLTCISVLYHLAGMALFIDEDRAEARRLLQRGLDLAKASGSTSQMDNAESFLRDMDAGLSRSEETVARDGALFGYSHELDKDKVKRQAEQRITGEG